ncbi:MAG: hypothetical protein GQ565_08950 [Candidatus Aegiribacteria sp.]|nr:hypothetical protein [Candidatus Aegiribacteria sp.]
MNSSTISMLKLQGGALVVLLSLTACTSNLFQNVENCIPPDSLVVVSQSGLNSTVMFNAWLGSGPDGSIIIESLGEFYLFASPNWAIEQFELELPIPLHDMGSPSLDMVYCDELGYLVSLVGNGLFRIPWGDHEADSILVLGSHYSNNCWWNSLTLLQDSSTVLACIDKSIYLINSRNMTVLDSLHFNTVIRTSVVDNEKSLVFLLHSTWDSISVVDVSTADLLTIQRMLYPNVELENIGLAGDKLIGQRRGSLFVVNSSTGVCTSIWSPPDGSIHRFEWMMAYPWGPYKYRVDHENDLMEMIDLTDLSVRQSVPFNTFFKPLIYYTTAKEGIVYHPLSGTVYRLIPSD